MSTAPVLELRGIDKSFGPVQVLHDVAFSLYPGEVTALVGDNGAGKSTLVKCIGGIHPIDSGEYLFEGKQVHVSGPATPPSLGVEIVYQDLALCDNLDIVQNMFLGREQQARHRAGRGHDGGDGGQDPRWACRSAPSSRSASSVSSLSGGQRQTVAIAKAVLWNSKVVILDEPTAALGVAQTAQVLDLVRRLADKGLAVVLISHNMNDVFAVVRPHRRPLPRPDGRPGQDRRRHHAAGRGAHHRRPQRRSLGLQPTATEADGMSAHHEAAPARGCRARRPARCRSTVRDYVDRVARRRHSARSRAVIGLIVLCTVFAILRRSFLTAGQLRQPVHPGRGDHRHRDGPGVRPAARRDRPVGGLRQRCLRGRAGRAPHQRGLALVRRRAGRDAWSAWSIGLVIGSAGGQARASRRSS